MTNTTTLIIGNGFDLNLQLKTSYTHFIESIYFKDKVDTNLLMKHIYDRYKKANWVDIEKEFAPFSQLGIDDSEMKRCYLELKKCLQGFLLHADIDRATHQFGPHGVSGKAFQFLQINGNANAIVNFNYTHTVIDFLRKYPTHFSTNEDVHHFVHGSLDDRNIIFGTNDGADLGGLPKPIYFNKSVEKEDVQIIRKLNETRVVKFFGLSLGETDHSYFRQFFERISADSNEFAHRVIEIHFYGEESKLDIHRQLDILTKSRTTILKANNTVRFIPLA